MARAPERNGEATPRRAGTPAATRRPLAQRLLRGGSWAALGKAMTMPVAFALAVILARVLEPTELGGYFLATSLAAVAMVLVQLGLGRAMIKLVAGAIAADRPATAQRAIRLGSAAIAAAGLLAAVVLLGGGGGWLLGLLTEGDRLRPLLPWLALLVVAMATGEFGAEILRGFQDLRSASLLGDQLLQRLLLVLALLALWAVAGTTTLDLVLALAAVAATFAAVCAALLVRGHLRALGPATHRGPDEPPLALHDVLRQGPPFLLMRLNFWLLAGAGIWVLGMYRPAAEVAVFGAATYLALLVQAPVTAVNAVLMPVAAELLNQRQMPTLARVARGAAAVSLLPSLAFTLLLAAAGGLLLGLVFGPAYAAGHAMVAILACGRCIGVALGPCPILLTMSDYQRDVAVVMTAMSALTLVGYLALAPAWGGLGIAIVVAASITVQSLVMAALTRWRLGILVWPQLSIDVVRRLARRGAAAP